MKNKIFIIFLSLCILISSFPSSLFAEESIVIASYEDLENLSKNCADDDWSLGKTVVLACDISLKDKDFEPIASFSGSFDGQNFSITDFNIEKALSPAGLFGILQKEGSIKNLKLQGSVTLHGEKTIASGLCGINYGTISNCIYTGSLTASDKLGGIAAVNESSGMIENCKSYGAIYGTSMTGGIVGFNKGRIESCTNFSSINTKSIETGLSLDAINLDASKIEERFSSDESLEGQNSSSDTGGIAGYSKGFVENCVNRAYVGYSHIGYNVGGICGRSTGYVHSCINKGRIEGRKDVGGIVGQLAPYIELSLKDNLVTKLRKELNLLKTQVDTALNDSDNLSDDLNGRFTEISSDLELLTDDLESLSGKTTDFVDENIEDINELADRISYFLDEIPGILDILAEAGDYASKAIEHFSDVNKDLKMDKKDLKTLQNDSKTITTASASLDASSKAIKENSQKLRDLIEEGSEEGQEEPGLFPGVSTIQNLTEHFDDIMLILSDIMEDISDCMQDISDMTSAAGEMAEILTEYLQTSVPDAQTDLDLALKDLNSCTKRLTIADTDLKLVLEKLNEKDEIVFSDLGEDFDSSMNEFFTHLRGVLQKTEDLNDAFHENSRKVSDDLKLINAQLNKICNTCIDIFMQTQDADVSDIFEDVSDENIHTVKLGKIQSCKNLASIYGDKNTGGIAGALSIESEVDPELESNLSSSVFSKVYETKAIIEACENYGKILAKKECVGGISGLMELGYLIDCNSYGTIESENGDYIGGIAGKCASRIKNCKARCFLSGKSYIGGIIGGGKDGKLSNSCSIENCISLVKITNFVQFYGAIAGSDVGNFKENVFVSDDLRGINKISKKGRAEKISYEDLLKIKDLPENFKKFSLSFENNGKELKSLNFSYDDSFDKTVFPTISEKPGFYAIWSDDNLEHLHFDKRVYVEYLPYITALESDKKRENNLPVLLVEGNFHKEDSFSLNSLDVQEEDFSPYLKDFKRFLSDKALKPFWFYDRVYEIWSVNLKDDGEDHTLRFLPLNQNTQIFIKDEEGFKPIPVEKIGSYLCFKVSDKNVSFAAVQEKFLWKIPVAAGMLLAILAILIGIVKKKKK